MTQENRWKATLTGEPLGLLRLRVERRLGELAEVMGERPNDLWEFTASATEIPKVFAPFGETGLRFWDAFQNLRRAEAEELNEAVARP